MNFNPAASRPLNQFTLSANNYLLRCQLASYSVEFCIEQSKDNIKHIYNNRFYLNTLPDDIQQFFQTIEQFYNYISDNPHQALNFRDLFSKNVIYFRANCDGKIVEMELPMEIKHLQPEQMVKRENNRLKETLQKVKEELNNCYKIINELKVNECFNNEDFQKIRVRNKKIQTLNKKIVLQKNALIDQNIDLKTRLGQIKSSVKEFEATSHPPIDDHLSVASKSVFSQSLKASSIKEKVSQIVDLDHEEADPLDKLQKNSDIHGEQSSANISQHNSAISLTQNELSVASRPHSVQSNSLFINLQKISALSEIPHSVTSNYSKKEQKQHKKAIKFMKEFTYFEDNSSYVCKSKDQNDTLFNFFIRKIKELKLLYRASQNNFEISRFHKACDGKKHTILLVETEFGRKIGAYTPLEYESLKKPRFKIDQNCETFLFSLTNKQKYKLINSQKALFNFIQLGPSFGRLNLHIEERTNMIAESKSFYPFDFENQWKTKEEAFSEFTGAMSEKFKILEWEVYQIEFWQ